MNKYIFILLVLFLAKISTAQTQGSLEISVKTSDTGGKYAPRNVMAIWVENSSGEFVKTLLTYADKRITHLNNWQESTAKSDSEFNTIDAITGATRSSHSTRTCSWDATNTNGSIVDDGNFKLCMELTDKNNTGNFTEIEFTKTNESFEITPSDGPSFSSITISWTPVFNTFNSITKTDKYTVFPSPTNGQIHVSGDEIEWIEISNLKGAIIYKGKSVDLDISNHAKGIYQVNIYTKDDKIIRKISKH
ncbi:MAG: DUF2271 domain-containing protein [Prolixibacteraceae bacterium]|jgi:hypothetical protein|nr:DUF2271 domain-containing protein [Prolixibacteraceae bacterium]